MRLMQQIPLLAALLAAGCATTGDRYQFPADISDQCYRALAETKAGIESCGMPLTKRQGLVVNKVQGEQKIKGAWAIRSLTGSEMVYAEYNGYAIRIGCDPVTGEISYGMLHHEMGHYWLVSNYQMWGHPAQFDAVFSWSWVDDYLKGGKK